MRKCLKIFTFMLCCVVSALVFGACTDNTTAKVLVEKISVDKGSITLVLDDDNLASSKQEIQISYEPANSTQVDVEFFQYDTSLIEITQKQNTGYTYIITAKDFEGTTKQTTIGIRMKGNVDVQTKCIVKVEKKSLAPLTTPQNLEYDSESGVITWDKSSHTTDEGFDGYTLKINNQEIYCYDNFYELTETGTLFDVQVKTNSIVSSKDSAYSESYKFKILPNLTNLKHENGVVSWESVEGASGYSYQVGVLDKQVVSSTITSFNYTFETKGTYTFKVQALGENITNEDQTITHVFDSAPSQIQVTKLSAPENFMFSKFFQWNTPSLTEQLPQGYEIVEIVGDKENVVATTKDNYYVLGDDILQGEHTYKIRALGDNKTTITSDFSATKTITKLATPQNLRVENGVITWDKDINAVSYHLIFKGMFDGTLYADDYYNTDKNVNSYFYIDQPQTEGNKVTFLMGEKFTGQYIIKIASVSDAENTVDSNFTNALTVTKLNAPDVTSFGLTNNVLSWNAITNASAYNIELFLADDSVVTDTVFTNSYTLPQNIAEGEFSFRLTAIGDSTKNTLTSDKSELGYSQVLCTPVLFVQDGVLKWEMPRVNGKVQDFSSFVLVINGTEKNMAKQTEFDFAGYNAGTYNVKIKAKGGNSSMSGDKFIIGTIDSAYSSLISAIKYSIPALKLEEGEIKASSIDDIQSSQISLFSEKISDTEIKYTAKVLGKDATHISSELSSSLTVTKAQKVQNLQVKNGVLSWDKLSDSYKGAYFELEINSVVDGTSNSEVFDMGTSNSKDFSTSDYLAGTYSAKVRIIGTTSNKDARIIQSSDYSEVYRFYKLPQPQLSATGAMKAIQSSSLNTLPGLLTWDIASVNDVQAQGYTITATKSGTTNSYNVTADNYFTLPTEAGTYKIKIEAYGNGAEIINSGFSEEIEFEKLSSATNLAISLDGVLSWKSSYNAENDSITNLATKMPLKFRVLYVLDINGEYYCPYDISGITSLNEETLAAINKVKSVDFNEIRQFSMSDTDPVKFGDGTYTVKILTLPLNYQLTDLPVIGTWGYLTDLQAEYSNTIQFTKLETPYGFRVDRDYNDDYIISWTRSLNANVSGYELLIKEAGAEDSEGITIAVGNNTTYNFTQDYLKTKNLTSGSYVVKVRCLTTTSGYIASDYCDELTLNILDNLSLSIKNGKLSWDKQDKAVNYVLKFKKDNLTITVTLNKNITEYALTTANNAYFTAGEYTISAQVIGDSSSDYTNQVYLSTLSEKNYGTFTKLETPTNLKVVDGLINFECASTPINYTLYVVQNGKTQNVNIKLQKKYELESSFGAGKYSFTVQAMGGTEYLNSEISDVITPSEVEKLASPTLYLKDGILNWNYIENANTYQLEISGASFKYEVKVPEGVTSFDVSGEITDINGNKFSLTKGQYSIKIKAIGTSKTYLNSNYSTVKTFTKLATPQNLQIKDGVLTWDKITSKADAPNGIALYVSEGSASYRTPIVLDISKNSFDFAGINYPASTYSIYLQTIGDTNSNFSTGNVCGTATDVLILEKLASPTNAKVSYSSDIDVIGIYTFDKLNKTEIANPKYLLKINLTLGDISKELSVELDTNEYVVKKTIEGVNLISGAEIQFSVMYLGEDKFINSEYNTALSIVIPATPTLTVVVDEKDRFTGKLTWNEVKVGNNATEYILVYQFISLELADSLSIKQISDITETHWKNTNVENIAINTSNLYTYVMQRGYYRFKVLSTLVIRDGDNSENSTVIKSPEDEFSGAYNYCLFNGGGLGTQDDPFIVDSAETFNFIRYNLTAHYKLSKNIDFTGQTIYSIGSEQEAFIGSFDGDNKVLYNISISKVSENSSIFDYLGKGGVIKNVIVQNINITNGSNVGGIVGRNLGTISNVIVGAKLDDNGSYVYDTVSKISPYSTSDQFVSKVGGICGLNEGTIENCINYAVVAPRNDYKEVRSGGIAGENTATITNCFNYNSIGGTGTNSTAIFSNMSGGICGLNEGTIEKSGNYGNVYAITRNINNTSQSAYAGGVVGYNYRGTLSSCFNDNSNRNYDSDKDISAQTQIYGLTTINYAIYVGGLVGDNSASSTIKNCYTLSNIQYNVSGTSSRANVGAVVGNNSANYMSTGAGIRFYVFKESMVQDAGNNIASQSFQVYGCTQINNELDTFKNYVKNNFEWHKLSN